MPIEYSQRERPYELYRKGKREGTWDPDHFDFAQDREDWQAFTEEEQARFLMSCSGFYEGEENVTRTLAPYMVALDELDDDAVTFDTVQQEMYLSQQVYEEAKHTDFFSRYYEEVFGHQDTESYRNEAYKEGGYNTDDLFDTADELLAATRDGDTRELVHAIGEAYLNYMGLVEAQLARGGYMAFDQMTAIKADELGQERVLPGFQDAVAKIRQDETRHIENGRWVMKKLTESHPDVVASVYEPRMIEYIRNRLVDGMARETPFKGYDQKRIGRRSVLHLQDTVDYIGAGKFDRLADVQTFVKTMRADTGETAATEGDD